MEGKNEVHIVGFVTDYPTPMAKTGGGRPNCFCPCGVQVKKHKVYFDMRLLDDYAREAYQMLRPGTQFEVRGCIGEYCGGLQVIARTVKILKQPKGGPG